MSPFPPSLPPGPAGLLAAAGVAWIAALGTLPRYLRGRRDVRLSAYWHTLVLLALALTLLLPAVYTTVDRVLRLPNAARWLSNALVLASACMVDTFFSALAQGPRRLRWSRPGLRIALGLTLAAMALLLWRAGLPVDDTALDLPRTRTSPTLVTYRLVFLGFLSVVSLRSVASAAYYRRHSPHLLVQLGMALLGVGGVFGLGNIGCMLAILLAPVTSPWAHTLHQGVDLSLLASVLCVVLASTAPGWGRRLGVPVLARHLHALVRYGRLHVLWRRLSQAHPEVVLPTTVTWGWALLCPHALELLLYRSVIEILDARRLLLTRSTARADPTPLSEAAVGAVGTVGTVGTPARADAADVLSVPGLVPSSREWPSAATRCGDGNADHIGAARALAASATGTQLAPALDHMARVEAWLLAQRLSRGTDAPRDGRLVQPLYRPATYQESLDYLERVAAALRAYLQHNRRALTTSPLPSSAQASDRGQPYRA